MNCEVEYDTTGNVHSLYISNHAKDTPREVREKTAYQQARPGCDDVTFARLKEGFIRDVLQGYTPVNSYYRVIKTIEDDPEFDAERAMKKLRKYVEGHEHAIRKKAEIMIDHFHLHVAGKRKLRGKARAMVIARGINAAMQYKTAFDVYLAEKKSPYEAIVAFSGKHTNHTLVVCPPLSLS